MPLFASLNRRLRVSHYAPLLVICLFFSVFSLAQINLTHRLINGYSLSSDAPVNKEKPTLFVFEKTDTFEQVFKPATTGQKPGAVNFGKDMVIGIVLPSTAKPPKLSVSKVFVQDSTLTVRYIRMADTTTTADRLTNTQPVLLMAIPKQTVLKTRLIENGRVVQTLKKREENNE